MRKIFWLTYITIILGTHGTIVAVADTLKFTQIIFRHGERTADTAYGIYKENFSVFWPEGHAQLTDVGKRQAYELGRFIRKRYDGFLSDSYNSQEMSVWSSAKDRTITSSLMCMSGIYKTEKLSGRRNEAFYEPIPIRTIPEEMDMFLSLEGTCPRRDELADSLRLEYFQEFCRSNPKIFEYFYNNTREEFLKDPLADVTTSPKLWFPLLDTVLLLIDSNRVVEEWMRSDYMEEILPKLRAYQYYVFEHRITTAESRRLLGGSLVDLITQNFRSFSSGLIENKVLAYGGHDKSILIYMLSLGIYDVHLERVPPFASALFLELHQNSTGADEPRIEFWYRNETQKEPYHLISSTCGSPCTLRSLVRITSEYANINYEEECQLKAI